MKSTRKTPLAMAATAVAASSLANGAVSAINVTGWNEDMIHNQPTNATVTATMDNGLGTNENWTWIEAGTYTDNNNNSQTISGIVSGTQTSLTGNGTFDIQPADGLNVLAVAEERTSATLTLTSPAAYSSIALYGAAARGPVLAEVVLNFTDRTSTTISLSGGITADWFNTSAEDAFSAGSRGSRRSEDEATWFIQTNGAIGLNESFLTLSPGDSTRLLESIDINYLSPETNKLLAVFAVSGELTVPEPSSAVLVGAFGLLGMLRRRR